MHIRENKEAKSSGGTQVGNGKCTDQALVNSQRRGEVDGSRLWGLHPRRGSACGAFGQGRYSARRAWSLMVMAGGVTAVKKEVE